MKNLLPFLFLLVPLYGAAEPISIAECTTRADGVIKELVIQRDFGLNRNTQYASEVSMAAARIQSLEKELSELKAKFPKELQEVEKKP